MNLLLELKLLIFVSLYRDPFLPQFVHICILVLGPFFTTICSHLYSCTGTLFYHNLFTFVSLYWDPFLPKFVHICILVLGPLFYHNLFTFVSLYWNPFLPQFVHICNRTFWLIWYVSPMISNMDRMWVLWPELKEYKSQLLISDTQ